MYTGQAQRGLGCGDCANRPTATGLGIAPAIAAEIIKDGPKVLTAIENLFGINTNGSYDETHAQILKLVQKILSDPIGAVSGQYLQGDGHWLESAANAYMALRCWAGDQTILPAYRQVSGDPAQNGCGCETAYGCRRDAQQALQQVNAQLGRTSAPVSSAPIPSDPSSGVNVPGGTIYQTLPGGAGINIPVPASSLFNATLFGLPVSVLALGAVAIAFAGGHRRGGRR